VSSGGCDGAVDAGAAGSASDPRCTDSDGTVVGDGHDVNLVLDGLSTWFHSRDGTCAKRLWSEWVISVVEGTSSPRRHKIVAVSCFFYICNKISYICKFTPPWSTLFCSQLPAVGRVRSARWHSGRRGWHSGHLNVTLRTLICLPSGHFRSIWSRFRSSVTWNMSGVPRSNVRSATLFVRSATWHSGRGQPRAAVNKRGLTREV